MVQRRARSYPRNPALAYSCRFAVPRPQPQVHRAQPGADDFWQDIFWSFEALADGEKARSAIARNASYEPETGFSQPAARHWIHSLAQMGPLDPSVTGDSAMFAVFRKGEVRTYVAYNPNDAPRKVTFSDGHDLDVPARSLHHESRKLDKVD